MVRETRHLWVGNLPDNIREERIREHFKRYGRVQSVKLLPRVTKEETGEITMACTVAFMDIKSASKAHNAELKIDDRTLNTEYYEPAAIPSAASPQNTPSPYSTSPGTTRFPNGHGSSDEHGSFPERFYDRTTTRVASDSEFIRRTGYHETNRGRNRDRTYRNGPYNALNIDRHRTLNNTWSYDVQRYNNSTTGSQTETGYSTTPTETNERRNSDQSGVKKKTKSRSGSRSPSPSGSTSSRSPSRSRSRSSSSSSSSSTSRGTSSTSSPKSRRLASSGNSTHQPVVHSDDRRPLAICVKNLPLRSSDTSLKDGLFHEYKKHGKVTWVKVVGQSADRYAIVCFKKPEDVEKALEVSYDKLFFGCKIEVAPYIGYDVEDNDLRPYEAEIDEFHPKATRTLFIGNLEKDVTASDLRKHFDQFGEIIEIDIKKQGVVSSYAFCQYSDIVSVVKAIRKMDGEHLGNNRIKLGFGKSMPTNCVWVDGVGENVTEKYLRIQFEQYGVISKLHVDREKGQALIFYEQVVGAQSAVNKMRGFSLKNNKIQVDFASRECQESFFEHLEKQGAVLDRTVFEERRDSTSRSFDSTTNRFSRYDTPTRPRTSSYSSRSSAAASQVTSAIPSPGTPGSVTPRGTGSTRSRMARFAEYYEPGTEYPERHFRNYDEYSLGSPASHEDGYEHEYPYPHDSPSHLEPIETRLLQNTETTVPFAPPDIRNLQKERVHLLEQLEECPSSGDELTSPKKRLKLDLIEGVTSEVVIETNRDHRKVMEIRRLSDANINKHHSRRPSLDSGKHATGGREIGGVHERTYMPHAVCKRRKTAGSDGGNRVHHYDHSGSESVGGSRPGTPLCDERPENFQPSEPRRIPREREGPLTLPLPRFAAQVMNRGSVSVAGIKGQKDNVLTSPPTAVTSPRISNPRPPSPVHVPPPASPPPRPPSLSSNSSDSDITPPSPSLEERIRSLDEKYEKWSGSRALSAAGGDALATIDANLEKFRSRHKLLDLDLKEVQPSDIVKSVMAKRSVFDEDLKRLENVGEKYEPKEFCSFPRTAHQPVSITTIVPAINTTPLLLPAAPTIKLASSTQIPKTPPNSVLSPRSAGTIPAAKGLQYPFPSHPPIQTASATTTAVVSVAAPTVIVAPPAVISQNCSSTPPTVTTVSSALLPPAPSPVTVSSTTTRSSHGENRLKPCVNASSDNRTSSKVNVNRTVLVSSLVPIKNSEKSNIPNASDVIFTTTSDNNKLNKSIRESKSSNSDKPSERVQCRRDSTGSSPRADIRTRRNSDTNARRIDDADKFKEINIDQHKLQQERAKSEERKREQRLEKVRLENERLEKEKAERERIDRERIEKEKQEKELFEKERLEKERQERESELEKQRLEKERLEKERIERERQEQERRERREKEEREKREREEQLERERREREEHEKREAEERHEKEKQERERERKERHKDDNHEKRKDEQHRHRENHNRDNHIDKNLIFDKNTKDNNNTNSSSSSSNTTKEDLFSSNSSKHESRSNHEKSSSGRHQHVDRDAEHRKESIKENRDNNIHDKHKNFANEINKERIESRHLSIDSDKSNRAFDNALLNKTQQDPSKRKERNNSLPANIGNKRRLSSHDSIMDTSDDNVKRLKLNQDHKKLSERRDSKDSRSDEKSKSKHKNNSISSSKSYDKYNNVDEKRQKDKEREERHKSKQHKIDKQKTKRRDKDSSRDSPKSPPISDKDFLARLDLRSTEEIEKQQKRREEKREKQCSSEKSKQRDDNSSSTPKTSSSDERKQQRKDRIRKLTQNSSDNTDTDEPKKHSIFDIVDDGPSYISMYDKVKARSCKNMQKQEEEKRQEKIKAKFSQLKQSRAKREEKKRSTSWDEDSDSDREKSLKRVTKIIASSDEDDERKSRKKKDMYSDSDSDRLIKMENMETSDDDQICTMKNQQFNKSSKSRIASDTSDDDNKTKIQTEIKSEIFSDMEDGEDKLFKVKDELERFMKKEHRHDSIAEQIFGDSNSPIPELNKSSKFNIRHSFGDNTSEDEIKKERTESRRKHKNKKKHPKHSVSSEDSCKLETVIDNIQNDCSSDKFNKHHEKKKQHSKKDKKRDKTKDDRSKKSKKNRSESRADNVKREGKMENIFGSLSEDSENGVKESDDIKSNSFLNKFDDEIMQTYNSESDREAEKLYNKHDDKEKDEHKKKKEKKRREKERRLQEMNENSMDFADMGKQLEANIKDESTDAMEESIKTEIDNTTETIDDESFRFNDLNNDISSEIKKEERKEGKEKKKKKKKNKEEKQKHHHHHHHHDKKQNKSPSEQIKIEIEEPKSQNQSLPNILDIPSPRPESNVDYSISPITREPMVSPIPKTPTTSKEKKLIPGFGADIDEKLHESAIQSISEFEEPVSTKEVVIKTEEPKVDKTAATNEEKPRVVISQEETEDAVAALLGESFGETQFEECYSNTNDQSSNLTEENNVQDDEEMRQAVQSLSSTDLDVKPETPQSEHELQIDTDTEEQEEITTRFDNPPKTPDIEITRPPKTPPQPYNFPTTQPSLYIKTTTTCITSSPPSLTPIKQQPIPEVKSELPPEQAPAKSLPLLPEQQRSVISKSWIVEDVPKSDVEQQPPKIITSTPIRTYIAAPIVKITEATSYNLPKDRKLSPVPEINKSYNLPKDRKLSPVPEVNKIVTTLHNLPARSPVQIKQTNAQDPGLVTPKTSSNLQCNRLPITPVMVSKPHQATTVILPQSKIAHTLEPPKLVSTSDPRNQDRPRMIFQTSNFAQSQQPQVLLQTKNLLVPSFGGQSNYNLTPNLPPLVKDKVEKTASIPPNLGLVVSTTPQQPNIIVTSTQQPFMPVIQETPPKLISLPPQQPTIIKQAQPQEKSDNHLKVIAETPRTSSPSPVIVATPTIVEKPPPPPPAPVNDEEKKEEPISKSAIETVTEELNLSLKKDLPEKIVKVDEPVEPEIKSEEKTEVEEIPPIIKTEVEKQIEPETVSVIKEMEKFDEEKADTESIISDISKERSSADILTKDDTLDTKEDSDYWSAKEVNIDSVIKTLCSGDELSDHSSEAGKDEWFDDHHNQKEPINKIKEEIIDNKKDKLDDFEQLDEGVDDDEKQMISSRGGRRGGRTRGRKARGGIDRSSIQTRRGKQSTNVVTPPPLTISAKRGGRGGRNTKSERKNSKSESENAPADVYEFRDDSDESTANKERPRLILTIKSPAVSSSNNNTQSTTAVVKEVIKDGSKEIVKDVTPPKVNDPKEEFVSPASNTRKSKRLQERDISRNTVDDTIEDVVRNTIQTRAAAAAVNQINTTPRRSGRQAVPKLPNQEVSRKSPRGGRKEQKDRLSETNDDSSEEKSKSEIPEPSKVPEVSTLKEAEVKDVEKTEPKPAIVSEVKEKPHEGVKAAMLRRLKGETSSNEPTNLIDPVTGVLTPMRECEEGRYIPLPGSINEKLPPTQPQQAIVQPQPVQRMVAKVAPVISTIQQPPKQPSVIAQPQHAIIQQQKPHSLKAHVLNSQAAKAVVSQQILTKGTTIQPTTTIIAAPKNANVTLPPSVPMIVSMPIKTKTLVKTTTKPPELSPDQMNAIRNQQQKLQQPTSKVQMVSCPSPVLKTQSIYTKQSVLNQQLQVVINKTPPSNIKSVQHQHMLSGGVPSPPLNNQTSRIIQSPQTIGKGVMEPPKIDVPLPNVILGARSTLSPQGRPFETAMGDSLKHFSPSSILRLSHDLPPHVVQAFQYQQYFRHQSYHMARSPLTQSEIEKLNDGQEGEEAPVTSPHELFCAGSVGLPLTGRGAAVPHSLQSPHDRTTDSPQVGQVFNVHAARMHYHPNRFYEQTEPPPAHRPFTSHSSLAHISLHNRTINSHIPSHISGLHSDHAITGPVDRPGAQELMVAGLGATTNMFNVNDIHIPPDSSSNLCTTLLPESPPLDNEQQDRDSSSTEFARLLRKYFPTVWQGLLNLKNDQAAVQMHFVSGDKEVALQALPKNLDGSTPPLRIYQRMRLEPVQVEGVIRKMQVKEEHCMLIALPCGCNKDDIFLQSRSLKTGFITYLTQKQAAGIINMPAPGTSTPPAYVVHIFPPCEFSIGHLHKISPELLGYLEHFAHLFIVITTV